MQEEAEICLMQLIWLSFRAEIKYYENKTVSGTYQVRSDINDMQAENIEREHQIHEVSSRMH